MELDYEPTDTHAQSLSKKQSRRPSYDPHYTGTKLPPSRVRTP